PRGAPSVAAVPAHAGAHPRRRVRRGRGRHGAHRPGRARHRLAALPGLAAAGAGRADDAGRGARARRRGGGDPPLLVVPWSSRARSSSRTERLSTVMPNVRGPHAQLTIILTLLHPRRVRSPLVVTAAIALLLAGCGSDGDADAGDGSLSVVASIYPLQHLVEQVAGDVHVDVTVLTAPGADPHALELSPRDVATMGAADLVVYSAGFQPAVDDAVATQASDHALDVSTVVDLIETADEHADHEDDGHEDDGHGHDHGGTDPHFWLDPVRYAPATE